jgi:acyl carrier protein
LKNKVIEIVEKTTGIESVVLLENSSEQLWDSLKHIEIVFLLEETFDIQLDQSDIVSMRSIDAILKVLSHKIGDKI